MICHPLCFLLPHFHCCWIYFPTFYTFHLPFPNLLALRWMLLLDTNWDRCFRRPATGTRCGVVVVVVRGGLVNDDDHIFLFCSFYFSEWEEIETSFAALVSSFRSDFPVWQRQGAYTGSQSTAIGSFPFECSFRFDSAGESGVRDEEWRRFVCRITVAHSIFVSGSCVIDIFLWQLKWAGDGFELWPQFKKMLHSLTATVTDRLCLPYLMITIRSDSWPWKDLYLIDNNTQVT